VRYNPRKEGAALIKIGAALVNTSKIKGAAPILINPQAIISL